MMIGQWVYIYRNGCGQLAGTDESAEQIQEIF